MAANPNNIDFRGIILPNSLGQYDIYNPTGSDTPINPNFFHLATDGVDSVSGGGSSAPFATLEFAQSQMGVGDGLYVRSGTHTLSQNFGVSTASQTFQGYPLNLTKPVFDCQNLYEGMRSTANDVTLKDIDIYRPRGNGGVIFGDVNGGLAENVVVTEARALIGGNLGGFVLSTSPNDTASNVTIRNCRANDIYVEQDDGEGGFEIVPNNSNASGIYSYGAENCLIDGFTASNTGNAIFWKRSTGLAGNICDRILGFNLVNGYRLSVAGNGDPIHYQQELHRFIFYTLSGNGLYLEIPDTIAINDTITIANGVVDSATVTCNMQNTQNFSMYNVISLNPSQRHIDHRETMILSPNDSDNNVFFGSGVFAYDRYTAVPATDNLNLAGWTSASGQDTNSSTSDPQFVDAPNRDYRILTGPFFGTGVNGKNYGAYREGDETIGASV